MPGYIVSSNDKSLSVNNRKEKRDADHIGVAAALARLSRLAS